MSDAQQPLFLARQTYRNRRLADAARVVPIVSAFLFMLPLLWTGRGAETGSTGTAGLWLFLAWFLLILVTGALSGRLRKLDQDRARTEEATRMRRSSDGSL